MSEMVERVANQLAARWQFYAPPGNSPDMPYWRNMARAAIEAMREPAPEMLEAADDLPIMIDDEGPPPKKAWNAMIDAALKED